MEGKTLAGRYRLRSKLGEGGMGSVWRADHLTLGTPVAIKLIDPSFADSTEAVARFKLEAQSAAELRSAHVVQIIDFGVDNGVPFIAMELLEGESLGARLERIQRLSPEQTAGILSQVARALARAHAAGIVHRDLKPENIYLVPEGDAEIAKVLDFGIAKKLGSLSASSGVKTGTGAMLGSPYYMSPEQALGHSTIDHRTDVWSLGIIAYQCLTGGRPFDMDTLGSLLVAICHDSPPVPSTVASVPQGFDGWFARCCARDPADRFSTALAAVAALSTVCGGASGQQSTGFTSRDSGASFAGQSSTVVQAKTSADLEHTALPASVTLSGVSKRRKHGVAVAIGGVALLSLAALVAARSFLQSEPTKTIDTSVALDAPTTQAHASAASAVQVVDGAAKVGTVANEVPLASSRAVPASSNAPIALELPRRTNNAAETKTSASPRALLRQPLAGSVPSASKPAISSTTAKQPRKNYEDSVGF